jgi:hypothetical protein
MTQFFPWVPPHVTSWSGCAAARSTRTTRRARTAAPPPGPTATSRARPTDRWRTTGDRRRRPSTGARSSARSDAAAIRASATSWSARPRRGAGAVLEDSLHHDRPGGPPAPRPRSVGAPSRGESEHGPPDAAAHRRGFPRRASRRHPWTRPRAPIR